MADVSAHYDGSAPSYHEQYDADLIWKNAEYPANYFRLQKVIEILRDRGVSSVYDLGAGEASPIIAIREALSVDIRASDLSPEMVRLGKDNLTRHNMDPDWLTLVDIKDMEAIKVEAGRLGQFDAVIALGVIPHVEDDEWFVKAMSLFLKPGGTLILQFRNSMFSMFTFNRLTKEFILEELMAPVPRKFRDVVEADLDQRLAVDKPPIRRREDGHGYDEILSKFNNPLELAEVVKSQGFFDLSYRWYNFHPTYPMVAGGIDAQEYRQGQIDLESDTSWRGMFLCSAGMIIATKAH
ncbi:MAG: class I SAM-dependent methyltransferase [Actinomycetota bacterium]|nr:class I SAM-dependent methyltransferase [Actinomycetota bacterium]